MKSSIQNKDIIPTKAVSECLKHSVRNQCNKVRESALECFKVLLSKPASRNNRILHYNLRFNDIKRITPRTFVLDI